MPVKKARTISDILLLGRICFLDRLEKIRSRNKKGYGEIIIKKDFGTEVDYEFIETSLWGKDIMKKLVIVSIFFAFIFTMIVPESYGQTRRKKKKNPGLATNIAIVAGSTAAGALIGRGRNGAMIGAGAGLLYASSRKGTKRRAYNSNYRRGAKIAGGTLLGAGTGAWAGGRTGMVLGGLAGAGATYLYTKNGNRYYRADNGRQFYVRNGKRYYVR